MKNSNLLIFVGVVIAMAVITTLALRACADKKPLQEKTYTQRQIDSVAALKAESDAQITRLTRQITIQTAAKDSLQKTTELTVRQLEIQTLKVRVLTREAQLARRDTGLGNFVLACDSLLPAVDSLLTVADNSRTQNRVLQNAYDSLMSTNSLYIAKLEFDKSFIQEKFDQVSANALQLEKANGKLDKKSSKKIIIGPSAGATYYNGKVQPYLGVGITYALIRL